MGPSTHSFTIGPDLAGAAASRIPLTIGPGSARLGGPLLEQKTWTNIEPQEGLKVTAWVPGPAGGPDRLVATDRLDVISTGSRVDALVPEASPVATKGNFSVHLVAT